LLSPSRCQVKSVLKELPYNNLGDLEELIHLHRSADLARIPVEILHYIFILVLSINII
jgi:hypothetical protein